MNRKLLIIVTMLVGALVALAQAQSVPTSSSTETQSQIQSPNQSSDIRATAIDGMGIKRYLMGPGDLLDVRVFGQSDLNSTVEIDADGNISSLPFIEEPIPARCRTEKEVQKSITDAYARYIVKPRVSVRIVERRSRPPATVFGAVRNPARVTVLRRIRLHELLATAGGVTAGASGSIQIVHTEPEMCPEPDEVPLTASNLPVTNAVASASGTPPVALTDSASKSNGSDVGRIESYQIAAIKSGSASEDPFIRPGDVVIVTEGEPIFVTGLVIAPQTIVMKDRMTLQRALATVGGTQRMAKTSEVHVYRRKDGKDGAEDLKYDFDAIRKGTQPDPPLQPYDIVEVRQVGFASSKNMAEIFRGMASGALSVMPMRVPIP